MGIQLKQAPDGSAGLEGTTGGAGEFSNIPFAYTATVASTSVFTATRSYVVQGIRGRVDVAGTGGACTFSIYKAPTGTAGASGTLLHSGTFNLVGTANAQQTLTLSVVAGALNIVAGDSIFIALTGVATSAVGNVSVALSPA